MSCFKPLRAWQLMTEKTPNGKSVITFDKPCANYPKDFAEGLSLPCGRCIGCRLERSRQWAMRCMHEASYYEDNVFLTLTYNDENLPKNKSLDKKAFQLFMKRLRKRYPFRTIRYYHCGEYGELCKECGKPKMNPMSRRERSYFCSCEKFIEGLGRPHYHAILFNMDFKDKILWGSKNGNPLYISEELSDIWGNGFCSIGEVCFKTCAYVARYIMKKINGEPSTLHYEGKLPEYTTMSRGRRENGNGGIGYKFYEEYKESIYANDLIQIDKDNYCRPASYYDRLFDIDDPEEMARLKNKRKEKANEDLDNFSRPRMKVKENIKSKQIKNLVRGQENEIEYL